MSELSEFVVRENDYTNETIIGRGRYGAVFSVVRKRDSKIFALKKIFRKSDGDPVKAQTNFLREVEILSRAHHPAILDFSGFSLHYSSDGDNAKAPTAILTPFMPGGTLATTSLDSTHKSMAIVGIAFGMAYLHSKMILHRDLKPENVFFDENQEPKIADFGCARLVADASAMTAYQGTPYYGSPESFSSFYSFPSDVYSFARVLFFIVTGRKPFSDVSEKRLSALRAFIEFITSGGSPMLSEIEKQNIPDKLSKIMDKCCDPNPDFRPSFLDIAQTFQKSPESYMLPGTNIELLREYMDRINEEVLLSSLKNPKRVSKALSSQANSSIKLKRPKYSDF